MVRMVAYVGWYRDTEVEIDVEDCGAGAGKTKCRECDGTDVSI